MSEGAAAGPRPLYGRPFAWLLFALAVLLVPVIGAMVRAEMTWEEIHPAFNALLNGSSSVFLVAGWIAIRRRRSIRGGADEGLIRFHRQCMIAAVTASGLFLVSYLARYYLTGSHRYPGDGWDKAIYLIILFSHMLLAMAVLPLALRALYLGLKGRWADHRRIARWAWPIWIYVSFTGVVVYLMLYPIANAIYSGP